METQCLEQAEHKSLTQNEVTCFQRVQKGKVRKHKTKCTIGKKGQMLLRQDDQLGNDTETFS